MVRSLVATVALGVRPQRLRRRRESSGHRARPVGTRRRPGRRRARDVARDTIWRLVSIGGKSVGHVHGRLHLGAHRFHADTGVNAVAGHLVVRGDRLRLRGVSSTAVGIAGPGSRWEGAQQDAYGNGDLVFVAQGHPLTLAPAGPGASPALV